MVSWLSNGVVVEIFRVVRNGDGDDETYSVATSGALNIFDPASKLAPRDGLDFLWSWLCTSPADHGMNVPGGVDKWLGSGASSHVFRLADGSGVVKQFKKIPDLDFCPENEVRNLKMLTGLAPKVAFKVMGTGAVEEVAATDTLFPPRLRLVNATDDHSCLKLAPLGEEITHAEFSTSQHQHQLVADGICFLRMLCDNDICHCDVRSPNILLTSDWRALFIDFGFSHAASKNCLSHLQRKCSPAQDLLNYVSVVHLWVHGVRLVRSADAREDSLLKLTDVDAVIKHCAPVWIPSIKAAAAGDHKTTLEQLLPLMHDGRVVKE